MRGGNYKMTKDKKKEIEQNLYNYRNLDLKIENIDLHITRLLNDVSYAGVSFEQRSSPTNAFNSSVENEAIKREEHQTEMINNLKQMKSNLTTLKQSITNSLNILNEEESKLVNLRYFQRNKKTWIEIGMTLGFDKNYCCRINKKILNKLVQF